MAESPTVVTLRRTIETRGMVMFAGPRDLVARMPVELWKTVGEPDEIRVPITYVLPDRCIPEQRPPQQHS